MSSPVGVARAVGHLMRSQGVTAAVRQARPPATAERARPSRRPRALDHAHGDEGQRARQPSAEQSAAGSGFRGGPAGPTVGPAGPGRPDFPGSQVSCREDYPPGPRPRFGPCVGIGDVAGVIRSSSVPPIPGGGLTVGARRVGRRLHAGASGRCGEDPMRPARAAGRSSPAGARHRPHASAQARSTGSSARTTVRSGRRVPLAGREGQRVVPGEAAGASGRCWVPRLS